MVTEHGKSRTWVGSFLLFVGIASVGACSASEPTAQDFRKALGKDYKVTDISSGITSGDENAAKLCQGFTMSEKGIRTFLSRAKSVSDAQIHDEFDWAPCFVKARLTNAEHAAVLEIRASGIGSVTIENGPLTKLGCAAECDEILSEKSK